MEQLVDKPKSASVGVIAVLWFGFGIRFLFIDLENTVVSYYEFLVAFFILVFLFLMGLFFYFHKTEDDENKNKRPSAGKIFVGVFFLILGCYFMFKMVSFWIEDYWYSAIANLMFSILLFVCGIGVINENKDKGKEAGRTDE